MNESATNFCCDVYLEGKKTAKFVETRFVCVIIVNKIDLVTSGIYMYQVVKYEC